MTTLGAVWAFMGLPQLMLITVLTGGAIAVVSLASRPTRALVILQMRGKGDFGRGIPYGVAIAAGGVVVLWEQALGLDVGFLDISTIF
jgi:prepilin peptidase CpaA